jgi:predicted DCC family thiol-disulfide oxidoreductase YuxK
LIRADKNKLNRFTSISSNYAQNILKDKMSSDQIGKFIVYLSKEGKIYSKSDAVIQVFIELGGLYNIVGILKIFPSSFRNIFYDFFASNRYKWFGKLDQCHLPPKEIADRFYL